MLSDTLLPVSGQGLNYDPPFLVELEIGLLELALLSQDLSPLFLNQRCILSAPLNYHGKSLAKNPLVLNLPLLKDCASHVWCKCSINRVTLDLLLLIHSDLQDSLSFASGLFNLPFDFGLLDL